VTEQSLTQQQTQFISFWRQRAFSKNKRVHLVALQFRRHSSSRTSTHIWLIWSCCWRLDCCNI